MSELSLPVGPRDHVRGAPDASVTLVEYGDVECPGCRGLEPALRRLLQERPKVRLVYRHLPLVSVHPNAYSSALALEAAAARGRFWELHDLLLRDGAPLGRRVLTEHAGRLGLDPAELLRPRSERYDGKVREDFDSGVASGVEGTPGLFLEGTRWSGRLDLPALLAAVDALAPAAGTP